MASKQVTRAQALRAGAGTLLIGAGATAASALAAACGASGAPAPPAPGWDREKATVQFYIYFDANQLNAVDNQLLAPWRAEHPGVQVEVLPQPGATVEAISKLTALLAGGTPPDVLWDLGTARNLSQLNLVQALDDLVARDKFDLGRFNAKMLDYKGRFQGKLYMVPHAYGGNALGLLFNRKLFQEAGAPEPPARFAATWTWAQWVELLAKLTRKGGDGEVAQFGLGGYGYFVNYPIPYGGQWLADDFKRVVCDSPETIQAYADYFDLVFKSHVTPQKGEAARLFGNVNLFLNQKVAVTTMGGWEGNTYAGDPAKGLDWAFMPFPKAKVATPDMGPVALALIKGSTHREPGWQLLKWLIQDSRLARFMTRATAVTSEVLPWAKQTFKDAPNPRPEVLAEGIGLAIPGDNILLHPKWTQMNAEVVTPAFNDVWDGKQTPAAALRSIKAPLQTLVDQG
jgi:multiple sugar transport system substrate-binding protein